MVGRVAFTIKVTGAVVEGGTGPVSTTPSLLVSSSGVLPSARNTWKVVPAGKALGPAAVTLLMLIVSVPLPVL